LIGLTYEDGSPISRVYLPLKVMLVNLQKKALHKLLPALEQISTLLKKWLLYSVSQVVARLTLFFTNNKKKPFDEKYTFNTFARISLILNKDE
jgi:hypothetical protein